MDPVVLIIPVIAAAASLVSGVVAYFSKREDRRASRSRVVRISDPNDPEAFTEMNVKQLEGLVRDLKEGHEPKLGS